VKVRLIALLSITFALGLTATACAPIPCASGYSDPDWCTRRAPGGGGGSAS
jgi:hypothetical protein